MYERTADTTSTRGGGGWITNKCLYYKGGRRLAKTGGKAWRRYGKLQKAWNPKITYYKAPKRFQPFPPFRRAKIKKKAYQTLNKLSITIAMLNILTYGN
jgi:hypothetical protein